MSLPPEVLKKVKLLEISTRKLVNNLFAGEYHTAFKGQGMTFADFREYVPGDDVRSISWTLTARAGKPYIKTYEEERELTLILAIDVSGSSDFGTGPYFKGEVMTHMAALLAFSAVKNNDQIGLLLFSDQVEHFVPPKKGRGHVHRLLRDLFYYQPKSHRTRLSSGFTYLQGVLKKKATIFIFSDFMDEGFEQSLRLLGRKHDVVACVVNDAAEYSLPDMGVIEVQDAESGEVLTVDTSSASFRKDYEQAALKRKDQRDRLLRLAQVERVDVKSSTDYVNPLVAFFKEEKIAMECKTEIPSSEGLNDNELTVGREFLLVCQGEFPKNLVREKLHFVLKPEEKYQIHLLDLEFRSSTQADIKVTSYQAGQVHNPDLQLSDDTQTLSLGPVQFAVQSVLQKPPPAAPGQPGQQGEAKQEPFGPIGPASVPVPMLYVAILASLVGVVILFFVAKVYRFIQRRNMLNRLKEHDSALSPLAQFHQSLRRLQRINTVFFGGVAAKEDIQVCVVEMQQMLKLFLTRRYQIPALEWKDRLILSDLKKYHFAIFVEHGEDLKKLLLEFQRGIQDKDSVTGQDALNIATHGRVLVEKMERMS